ncbi:hypothetical protein Tco_1357631, partial [Tanacetum coccineum]
MKAMAVSYFYCVESICKTMDVRERPIAVTEICRLKKLHAKLREGLLVKCRSARLHCPPDFDRMTKPDGWCVPDDHCCSGMVRRAKGTSCSRYDYYNPHMDGWELKFLIKMPPRRYRNINDVYDRIMARMEERLYQFVDQFVDRMNDMMNPRRRGDHNGRRSEGEELENLFFEGDGSSSDEQPDRPRTLFAEPISWDI